jgi:hypothetical protein
MEAAGIEPASGEISDAAFYMRSLLISARRLCVPDRPSDLEMSEKVKFI